MRQHAIPQNILDIEFKLFTKFTVREFVYMATGIGFGGIFLYYYTLGQLPGIVSFPVFLLSSGMGLFLGLININDQKADVFAKNYIWAITHPTQRVWKNEIIDEKIQKIKPEFNMTQGTMNRENATRGNGEIIGGTADTPTTQFIEQSKLDEFDQQEQAELARIDQVLQGAGATTPTPTPSPTFTPSSQVPVQTQAQATAPITTPSQPPNTPVSNQRLRLTPDNLANFTTTLTNPGPYAGNLNFKLLNKENQPISQAVLVIKDEQNRVISALQSDANGDVLSNKPFTPAAYNIEIQASGYTFSPIQLIMDKPEIPPIKILAN